MPPNFDLANLIYEVEHFVLDEQMQRPNCIQLENTSKF